MSERSGFLAAVVPDAAAQQVYDDDVAELGYVMNSSRLWAYDTAAGNDLLGLARRTAGAAGLSIRHRLLIVLATSAARTSSYCILAWGTKFGSELDARSAAAVVAGDDEPAGLDRAEVALVRWVRKVAARPDSTASGDVDALRAAGWSDRQVFAITAFAALRLAFATVNDALGAEPDEPLRTTVAPELLAAAERLTAAPDGARTSR